MKYKRTKEDIERDLYLKNIQDGKVQGPITGKSSVDKPWLKYYDEETIESDIPRKTIYEYIYDSNVKHMNRIAISYLDTKITYKQLFENIDAVAKSLIAFGVKEDDYVSIISPTTPETIYLFYALSKIGAASNMIDPRASEHEIEEFINETKSDILFAVESNDYVSKISKAAASTTVTKVFSINPTNSLTASSKLKALKKLITKKDENGKIDPINQIKSLKFERPNDWKPWSEFVFAGQNYTGKEFYPNYKEDKPVVVVHTGGTTGKAKGVMLTNDNLNAASFQCEHCGFDFQRHHKWYNIMPMFIAYGVGNGLHLPLAVGMEVIVNPKFDPKTFGEEIIKYEFNHVTGVPSHYDYLIESPVLQNKYLPFLLSLIMGGDKGREDREKVANYWLKEHNVPRKVAKGYGMTEATAAVVATGPEEANSLGSCGVPFSHSIIGIFEPKEEGEPVGPEDELSYGEYGEVCIGGPNIMYGYLDNPEEEKKVVRVHTDGTIWLHSQDLGRMDKNGLLYIEDRLKNLMALDSGFKVYPSKIENVIRTHTDVCDCKAVGVQDPDSFHGQRPVVYLVLKDDKVDEYERVEEELYSLCREKLPDYSQPLAFRRKDKLPLTKVGKIDQMALRKEFENSDVNFNVRSRKK